MGVFSSNKIGADLAVPGLVVVYEKSILCIMSKAWILWNSVLY